MTKGRRLFLTGAMLLMVVLGVLRYRVAQELETRLQAIRDFGYPVTLEDLEALTPPVADEENAALHILRAMDRYALPRGMLETKITRATGRFGEAGSPIPGFSIHEMGAYLEKHRATIDRLLKTPDFVHSRYPGPRDDPETRADDMEKVHAAVRLLALEAAHAEMRGQIDHAVEALAAGYAICFSLTHEYGGGRSPRADLERIVNFGVERLFAKGLINGRHIGQLAEWTFLLETPDLLERGYAGLRAYLIWAFNHTGASDGARMILGPELAGFADKIPLGMTAANALLSISGVLDINLIRLLDLFGPVLDAAKGPLTKALDVSLYDFDPSRDAGLFGVYVILIAPNFTRDVNREATRIAALRRIRAALLVEIYELIYFAPPSELEDAVPEFLEEVPEDPTSGKPLRYRREGKGYAIWAASEDSRIDPKTFRKVYAGDIVLRVPR